MNNHPLIASSTDEISAKVMTELDRFVTPGDFFDDDNVEFDTSVEQMEVTIEADCTTARLPPATVPRNDAAIAADVTEEEKSGSTDGGCETSSRSEPQKESAPSLRRRSPTSFGDGEAISAETL